MRDVGRSKPKAHFDQRAERYRRAQRQKDRESIEIQDHLDDVDGEVDGYWSLIPE